MVLLFAAPAAAFSGALSNFWWFAEFDRGRFGFTEFDRGRFGFTEFNRGHFGLRFHLHVR